MAIGASLTAAGAQEAAAPGAPAPSQGNGDLRLVVVVVVDQFRGDSLERYQRLFGPDGFRRLCEGGVWYQNAFFDHAHTVTGPGNATISTGAHPAAHGIIGDDWIDRRTGRSVGCVADPASPVVGVEGSTSTASPVQLTCDHVRRRVDSGDGFTSSRFRRRRERPLRDPARGQDGQGILVQRPVRPHDLEPVFLFGSSSVGEGVQSSRSGGALRGEELGTSHAR
jgi:hypothetical protein